LIRSKAGKALLIAVLAVLALNAAAQAYPAGKAPLAKNVILMISDGCGYNQIAATNYYTVGRANAQPYEHFPVAVGMSTYSTGNGTTPLGYDPDLAWSDFNYVKSGATDSASAGTAMATGIKTYDAAIGMDTNRQPLFSVTERAEALGKATGVVTSVQFSHATPATFVAHNVSRNNYAQIAEEMIMASAVDVIMGTGNPWFDDSGKVRATPSYQYVGGQTVWDALAAGTAGADANGDGQADPWTLVETRDGFASLISGTTPDRVLGVAQVGSTLQQSRSGDGQAAPWAVPLTESVPTLAEMTAAALNILDNDPDGLFLMVEGGAVDWAGHANQLGRLIEEEVDFNNAVNAVIAWVTANSNWAETLVIVTGDHETGYLTGPASGTTDDQAVWNPIVNMGKGNLPLVQWNSGNHTNSLIPFFARGAAANIFKAMADECDPVRGNYLDNTELAQGIFALWAR
jgi:alkaline phosphatase